MARQACKLQTRKDRKKKDTLSACSVLTQGAMLWGVNPVLGAQVLRYIPEGYSVTVCLISRP
jgi:hypothetical protein